MPATTVKGGKVKGEGRVISINAKYGFLAAQGINSKVFIIPSSLKQEAPFPPLTDELHIDDLVTFEANEQVERNGACYLAVDGSVKLKQRGKDVMVEGEGKIVRLDVIRGCFGFIESPKVGSVFFNISAVRPSTTDVTKILKLGQKVKFRALPNLEQPNCKWRASVVCAYNKASEYLQQQNNNSSSSTSNTSNNRATATSRASIGGAASSSISGTSIGNVSCTANSSASAVGSQANAGTATITNSTMSPTSSTDVRHRKTTQHYRSGSADTPAGRRSALIVGSAAIASSSGNTITSTNNFVTNGDSCKNGSGGLGIGNNAAAIVVMNPIVGSDSSSSSIIGNGCGGGSIITTTATNSSCSNNGIVTTNGNSATATTIGYNANSALAVGSVVPGAIGSHTCSSNTTTSNNYVTNGVGGGGAGNNAANGTTAVAGSTSGANGGGRLSMWPCSVDPMDVNPAAMWDLYLEQQHKAFCQNFNPFATPSSTEIFPFYHHHQQHNHQQAGGGGIVHHQAALPLQHHQQQQHPPPTRGGAPTIGGGGGPQHQQQGGGATTTNNEMVASTTISHRNSAAAATAGPPIGDDICRHIKRLAHELNGWRSSDECAFCRGDETTVTPLTVAADTNNFVEPYFSIY